MSRNFTPEASLIDGLLIDNTEAFEELFRCYCYPLYTYCNGKLQSAEDARRIVRTVFISLWENRHSLPENFSVSTYLYTNIRKAVVQCIHEKLANQENFSALENHIIPGFAVTNLQLACMPVTKIYAATPAYTATENNQTEIDRWWNLVPAGIVYKYCKLSLQKAFNIF